MSESERLEGYFRHDPTNRGLAARLFDVLLAEGHLERAREHAVDCLRASGDDRFWRYRLAVADRCTGRLDDALASLRALMAEGESNVALALELSRVEAAQGDHAAAAATLEVLLGDPALPADIVEHAVLLRLRALHRLGRLAEATALGEHHLSAQYSGQVAAALATVYIDADRIEDVRRLVQQAGTDGRPKASDELKVAEGFVALSDGDAASARSIFEHATEGGGGRAHLGLGLAAAQSGDPMAAKDALRRATVSMPGHLGSWHALAWIELLDGDLAAAERTFSDALERDRNFAESYGGLAIVAAINGGTERARELIRTAVRLDRRSLNAGTARALLEHGGNLRSPDFLEGALRMLKSQAVGQSPRMLALFARIDRHHPD